MCFSAYCPLVASLSLLARATKTHSLLSFPPLHPRLKITPSRQCYSCNRLTLNSMLQPLRLSCGLRKRCLVFVVDSQAEAVKDDASSVATGTDGKQRGKNKHKKCPNKKGWCQRMSARGEICWEMLESAADAFGWINPFLRQMAPSPCRADKPQSVLHPLLHFCVCARLRVCHRKK